MGYDANNSYNPGYVKPGAYTPGISLSKPAGSQNNNYAKEASDAAANIGNTETPKIQQPQQQYRQVTGNMIQEEQGKNLNVLATEYGYKNASDARTKGIKFKRY